MNRRNAIALIASLITSPAIARPGTIVSLRNVMGEKLTLLHDGYLSSAQHAAFNRLARDRREDLSGEMDGGLIDILVGIVKKSRQDGDFTLLSGFRTPATNARLPGAAHHSFHLKGQALDITREGMSVEEISAAATGHSGGLGLYPDNGFVHVDTGPSRRWKGSNGTTSLGQRIPNFNGITPDMLKNPFEF